MALGACRTDSDAGAALVEAPAASPWVALVLAPDFTLARAQEHDVAALSARLERVLLARASGSPLVRAARVEPREQGLELALDLVRVPADDELLSLILDITVPGTFEVAIVPSSEDRIDLQDERARLDAWMTAHPGMPLERFSAVEYYDGGPHPDVRWAWRPGTESGPVPLLIQNNPAWTFTSEDVAKAYPSRGPSGQPAVGFELVEARKQDFGDFTEANIDRVMAVLIHGAVTSVATIHERLPGAGILAGDWTAAEAEDVGRQLSAAAPLPVPLSLVEVQKSW